MSWIDVHTHLERLELSPDESLEEALAADVSQVITIGTGPEDWPTVLDLAARKFPVVGCTLGVHPHDAELFDLEAEAFIEKNVGQAHVVAVGEIGLDYYYDNAPRKLQRQVFERQMELAARAKLPVEIHTRDAEPDTAEVLKAFKGRVGGILHCFTSSWDLAKVALDCGFEISISGVVTFKNAGDLREVVRQLPLDRLTVETDAPFLAPVPHRGKKNRPAWVVHVAQTVADNKGIELPELQSQVEANVRRIFAKLPPINSCANRG